MNSLLCFKDAELEVHQTRNQMIRDAYFKNLLHKMKMLRNLLDGDPEAKIAEALAACGDFSDEMSSDDDAL